MIFEEGTRDVVKYLDLSGIMLFIVYAAFSVVIYYLCFTIFSFTNKKIPFIWGK